MGSNDIRLFRDAYDRVCREKRVFVSGTDTEIGKTLACGILASGWNAHYWKPVQSGSSSPTDSETMAQWINPASILPEQFVLTEPLSPNQSAERDGVEITLEDFKLPDVEGPLVVEGAGGLMVPLNGKSLMIDLASQLALPVVLVCRTSLGTINHTLLSIEMLKQRSIPLAGLIFSGKPHPENQRDISHFGKAPVIGVLPWIDDYGLEQLGSIFDQWFRSP